MKPIKVMLVDDHRLVRAGFKALLEDDPEIEIVGEASNGKEAIEKAEQLRPDVILMDISMPVMGGMEATAEIKKRFPDIKVLIVTMHDNEEYLFPVLRAGASGYIIKGAAPEELTTAIKAAAEDKVFLSPAATKALLRGYLEATGEEFTRLTPREREVLKLAAEGKSNREIAEKLFLSIKTVEKHRASFMEKLGLRSRSDLIKYALRHGLISAQED